MVLRIEKPVKGEMAGKVDPREFGFGVIKDEPPGPKETAQRVRDLYEEAKDRTGLVMPKVEEYLDAIEQSES